MKSPCAHGVVLVLPRQASVTQTSVVLTEDGQNLHTYYECLLKQLDNGKTNIIWECGCQKTQSNQYLLPI